MIDFSRIDDFESDLHRRVVSVMADVLQIDVAPNIENLSRKDTAEWDSINHLRLALELEDSFGISLPEDRWAAVVSLREVKVIVLECAREGLKSGNS